MKDLTLLGLLAILAFVSPAAAQSINIDFGPPGSGPASGYRAAGVHGFWNSFEAIDPAITYELLDVHGVLTDATVSQFGGTEIVQGALGGPGQPSGQDGILLGDAMVTHTTIESCLFFNGLKNGTYEVTTYAWMPTAPATLNNVHIDTNPFFYLVGGFWPGEHTEGVTYARHIVEVTTGFLGPHSGVPDGGNYEIGAALNGIQIRLMGEEPPLYLSAAGLEWLAALGADRYDVVRGDLATLRVSGGDFTAATEACVGEDLVSLELPFAGSDPDPDQAFWYVVRGANDSENLTYDAPGDTQVGSRDAEIDASPVSCS